MGRMAATYNRVARKAYLIRKQYKRPEGSVY
jgi:hypothetical protein